MSQKLLFNYRSCTGLVAAFGFSCLLEASEIEVLHMWQTESEQHALDAIKEAVVAKGHKWQDYSVPYNFLGVQNEFSRRVSIESPPTAVQWVIEEDMHSLGADGIFATIEDSDQKLQKMIYPEVYDLVAKDGKLAAIPVGIHTQNHIVYNKALLDKFSLKPAETWKELIGYGEVLAESGINLIAVSDQEWQVRNLALSIASSVMSVEEFMLLQSTSGDVSPLSDKIYEIISILSELRPYANNDSFDLGWEQVSSKVENGEALVQVLGDYIVPQFENRDSIYCDKTPQSNYLIWGMDGFVLPYSSDASVINAQQNFVDALLDEGVLKNYALRKGGIPINVNVSMEELDSCMRKTSENWNLETKKIWTGGQSWQKRLGIMGAFLSMEWKQGITNPDLATERLVNLLNETN